MTRRTSLLLAGLAALVACAPDEPNGAPVAESPAVPLASAVNGDLRDRYIVVFKEEVRDPARLTDELTRGNGTSVHFRYGTALKGFAASIPAAALEGIRRNPNVAYVEPDGVMTASATTQSNATWGLDRIDQRALPLSGSYTYDNDGQGVRAYILDTGIEFGHAEFGGRATFGYDAVGDGRNGDDCNGHGTHVAGTVGGTTYGVAKRASLVAVRVLNCQGSGTFAGVIAGIDWVAANAAKPAVANMSLGGSASSSVDDAVAAAVASGVTFAVAAGNSGANACNYSPARAASALTIGATTSTDARASYSNYGTCVDLFAPGSDITSAWHTTLTATNTISGTSMASPHVAGAAALYLAANPSATPAQVESGLESAATTGAVTSAGTGSPNLLLYSRLGGTVEPPPPPPPAQEITVASLSTGATLANRNNWRASVTATVSPAVSGATVAYRWSTGATGSCTTTTGGACTGTLTVKNNVGSVTYTVTNVTASGYAYKPSVTAATVSKP